MEGRARRAELIVAGSAVFAAAAAAARRPGVARFEQRCFAGVNLLPAAAYPPAWLVMQLGSLGGVAVVSSAAASSGQRPLARRLAVAGTVTWVGARVAKRPVRRARPAVALGTARILGQEQRGLGFPSGHAAVAAALFTVAAPELSETGRRAGLLAALAVGLTRLYVGAHLPLDVVGGFAGGAAVGAALRSPSSSTPSRSRSSWRSWRRG